jgi:dsRNA-specific ribonuclease
MKSSKRDQITKDPTPRLGVRGDQFKAFVKGLFEKCKVKGKYISLLTDDQSMKIFEEVFTHKSIDPISNYERFEIIGDITCNKFLVWYFSRRFPKLFSAPGVKILAELRIKYGSKIVFSPIAYENGFMPYISATQGEFDTSETSIREDVFEAFIGATEYILDMRAHEIVSKKKSTEPLIGVGYAICYTILSAFFDAKAIDISYQGLHPPISRLKELFDRRDVQARFGLSHLEKQKIRYDSAFDTGNGSYTASVIVASNNVLIGQGKGQSKVASENAAAVAALEFLRYSYSITDDDKAAVYNNLL